MLTLNKPKESFLNFFITEIFRWKHDKYEENPRNKRRGNYDRRDNYDDRRDSNWQKGGSWGNVNRHVSYLIFVYYHTVSNA